MILEQFRLNGKTALVTGCNTGLGRAMAAALAEAGADVVGVYRSGVGSIQKQVEQLGRRFFPVQADLSQCSPEEIIAEAVQRAGALDILVNNAGTIIRQDALEFTTEAWDEVLDVNLKALFFLSQAAGRQFVKQDSGGKIINVASMLSFQGGIRVAAYTASKHGVLGITRLLANEWAAKDIQVNAIAPGYMVTNNTEPLRNDPDRNAAIVSRIPAGRWGEPEELQGAVVYLASSASNYVTGATLVVDGGWLAR